MTNTRTESVVQGRSDISTPYSPSIVDRFLNWLERIPGAVWLFFVALLVGLIGITNAVTWLDGLAPFGVLDLYRTSIPVYGVASLVLIHYLNGVARRSLEAFRPALSVTEAEYSQIQYRLTTMPASGTWLSIGISIILTMVFSLFAPNYPSLFSSSPWLVVVDFGIYSMTFVLLGVFVYHTLHQLRMASRIHASATNISLFQPRPLYAFSKLTAQSGIGLLLMNYYSVLTDPTTFVNPVLIVVVSSTSLLAIGCFIVPLKGIHDRIVAEKNSLLTEAEQRLEAAIRDVFDRTDMQDMAGTDQLNQMLSSLIMTREELAKVSTWPWDTKTLAGFVSVFVLPLILRVVLDILLGVVI